MQYEETFFFVHIFCYKYIIKLHSSKYCMCENTSFILWFGIFFLLIFSCRLFQVNFAYFYFFFTAFLFSPLFGCFAVSKYDTIWDRTLCCMRISKMRDINKKKQKSARKSLCSVSLSNICIILLLSTKKK